MATVLSVIERFVKLYDALEHQQLRVEDNSFALVLSFDEARELYHRLMQSENIHYYTGMLIQPRTVPSASLHLDHPRYPTREHNVWMTILGITIVIKGTEDE